MLRANRSVSSNVRSCRYASIAITCSLKRTSALKFARLATSLSLSPLLSCSYIDSDSSNISKSQRLSGLMRMRLRDSTYITKYCLSIDCCLTSA